MGRGIGLWRGPGGGGGIDLAGQIVTPAGAPDIDPNSIHSSISVDGAGWATIEVSHTGAANVLNAAAVWEFTSLVDLLGESVSGTYGLDWGMWLALEFQAIPDNLANVMIAASSATPTTVGSAHAAMYCRSNGTALTVNTGRSGLNIGGDSAAEATARKAILSPVFAGDPSTDGNVLAAGLYAADGTYLDGVAHDQSTTGYDALDRVYVGVGLTGSGTASATFRARVGLLAPADLHSTLGLFG